MSDTAIRQAADFAGAVFRRGDAGYEAARRASCRNVNLPDRYPDIIVQAADEKDVMAAVRLANANSWAIGVRSGGHSWSCNHVRDGGMLLDVSRLNAVTIDPAQMRATVGPGCRGNQVDKLLAAQKLFFPIGHCEGVGLGGFLLQGGFGWHSRATGMACENVLAIDYVGADGELRHASAGENAEMYWAARGAGAGFFGVITRFHLKLYRRPKVIGTKLAFYTADHLEEIVRWAHAVGPQVPLSIELMFMVSRCIPFIDGPGIMVVAPVFADSIFAAWKDLDFIKTRPPGAKRTTPFIPMRLSTLTARVMHHYPDNHRYAVDNMWTRRVAGGAPPGAQAHRRQAAAGAVAYPVDELGAAAAAARYGVLVRGRDLYRDVRRLAGCERRSQDRKVGAGRHDRAGALRFRHPARRRKSRRSPGPLHGRDQSGTPRPAQGETGPGWSVPHLYGQARDHP